MGNTPLAGVDTGCPEQAGGVPAGLLWQVLGHLQVVFKCGQCIACPCLERCVITTLRITAEERDSIFMPRDLVRTGIAGRSHGHAGS